MTARSTSRVPAPDAARAQRLIRKITLTNGQRAPLQVSQDSALAAS